MKELKETVDLMLSGDFKDRFKAEYWQMKIRKDRLFDVVAAYEANKLTFTPKCSLELLQRQLFVMEQYLYILKVRAKIEEIELENENAEMSND